MCVSVRLQVCISLILIQKIFLVLVSVFVLLKYFNFNSILVQGNRYNFRSNSVR